MDHRLLKICSIICIDYLALSEVIGIYGELGGGSGYDLFLRLLLHNSSWGTGENNENCEVFPGKVWNWMPPKCVTLLNV
jgi:hypothetical protein